MTNRKTPFLLSIQKQWGVFVLLFLLFLAEGVLFFYPLEDSDSVNFEMMAIHQKTLDSLKAAHEQKSRTPKMYPFNPNFMSDYKAYTLGLPTAAFDRLTAFREQGKFVNSSEAFQKVTGIHDTLLEEIQTYFKFPDWTNRKKKSKNGIRIVKKDINLADESDFRKVSGIGFKLSERIVKYRNYLSGFVEMKQCYEVYGLDSIVVGRMFDFFEVKTIPQIKKKPLATISLAELERIPYLTKKDARTIIMHRTQKGSLNMNDLLILLNINPEKEGRLNFYLY